LLHHAKLGGQKQCARLALAEEFILEVEPSDAGAGVLEHGGLLQVGIDRPVDPREDGAVHLHPRRAIGMDHVSENIIGECVLAEDDKEEAVPSVVVVHDAVEDHGNEHLDVHDDNGGGVDIRVLGLELIEFLGTVDDDLTESGLLGLARLTGRGFRHQQVRRDLRRISRRVQGEAAGVVARVQGGRGRRILAREREEVQASHPWEPYHSASEIHSAAVEGWSRVWRDRRGGLSRAQNPSTRARGSVGKLSLGSMRKLWAWSRDRRGGSGPC
jgi:hypothetical protein